jgi:alpha-glucosidase
VGNGFEIDRRALFSDITEEYVTPVEPQCNTRVSLRFRTARNNADRVCLMVSSHGEIEHYEMYKVRDDRCFNYYQADVMLDTEKIQYYFEVHLDGKTVYYSCRGPIDTVPTDAWFTLIPGFSTPDWAKGAVMYQIFVDRFYNGDTTNDVLTDEYWYIDAPVKQVQDWNSYPMARDIGRFYGGDLQGVLDKMDYLQELGIDVIYFNPVFVSPSNHKYDTQDYDYIDPHYGVIVEESGELLSRGEKENRRATKYRNRVASRANLEAGNELFIRVVEEAHKRGMRVILDGVFNHCGSFHKWMDGERIYENREGYPEGAFISAGSPYRHYFDFTEDRWPYNSAYEGWWGHSTLPKLNFEGSRKLTNYILEVGKKWVSPPYNVDGWRLDVAADLGHTLEFNHFFWQQFRKAVKEANPEAIILAEHYGDTKPWLQGNEWDTVMNYDAFMEPVTWFLTGMEKHSDAFKGELLNNAEAFWATMGQNMANLPGPSLQTAMNELSNHDHSRFLTRTNHVVGRIATHGPEAANANVDKAVFREAVTMQMTWVGAPTIYYGDEAGVCGFTDPDNRRSFPWGREDQELIAFHKELIALRKQHVELRTGALKRVDGEGPYLAYGRFQKEGQCLILINNGKETLQKDVYVRQLGVLTDGKMCTLLASDANGYCTEGIEYEINDGTIHVELPPTSAWILKFYA